VELNVDRVEVLVGGDVVYEVVAINRGPHGAEGCVLEIEWMGKVDLESVELSRGDWTPTAGGLVCELGEMEMGAEATLRLVVRPARPGELICEVTVRSAVHDPFEEDNESRATVLVLPPAELKVTQTASPKPVLVGDQLTYEITVRNDGGYAVPDVRVVDWLPEGVDFVTAVTSQGLTTTHPGVIEWDLGSVEAGTGATVLLTVVPWDPGLITNRVEVLSAYVDPADPNLVSELETLVVDMPPLWIELDGSRIVVSWPLVAEDYVLFVAERLTPGAAWLPDTNPREIEGNRVTVTVKVTDTSRFYRLVRP
jgi:uncharacterized repeat protein (TIGR01451 family)